MAGPLSFAARVRLTRFAFGASTLFVGANLFQSAFTNWCPMMVILRKGGLADGPQSGTPVTSAR
jgi:hypothetical protein